MKKRYIPIEIRKAILDRCIICNWKHNIQLHHVKEFSKGGSNTIENIVGLCPNHHKLIHSGYLSPISRRNILFELHKRIRSDYLAERIKEMQLEKKIEVPASIYFNEIYDTLIDVFKGREKVRIGELYRILRFKKSYKTFQRYITQLGGLGKIKIEKKIGGLGGTTKYVYLC